MIDIICALCGKNQRTEVLFPQTFTKTKVSAQTYSARRMPDKIHYQILRCKRCGLIFSSPIFKPEQIENLYKNSLCNYDEQIPYLKKTYMNLFKKALSYLPQNPKVLEIGCGNGFFLEALQEFGVKDVYGVEPSKKIVSKTSSEIKKRIKTDIFKKNLYPKNTFDAVCCFHTLDHIVDVNNFVSEIFSVLKKDGIALIVVHDTDGLSVKIFGEGSPIFDIEHIYLFNKKTLDSIFNKHNFKTIELINLKNRYPLIYWLRMAHIPINLKKFLFKSLKSLRIDKTEIETAAGNIALIAAKK